MAEKISKKLIGKLQPPSNGNRIHYDSEIPGFGVRITAAGVVSFVLNYHIHGRERRFTIGRYPELTAMAARERALQLRGRILDGHDPLGEREQERGEPTFRELAAEYLEKFAVHHKRPICVYRDRKMLDGIIRPRLERLRVRAIDKRDIEALHAELKSTPYHANRVLALLSKMFSVAKDWGWCDENPTHGVARFHEDRRERWLTVEELQTFTAALDAYSDQRAANALRLLMLTGARASEVLKADWTQFDLKRGIWTKPSHHTKQQRIEHVPLSAPALKLLEAMRTKHTTGPLFPGANGKAARVTLQRPWRQVCKAAGLVEVTEHKGKRRKVVYKYWPTVRIHDLRHTFASQLVSDGVSLEIVGKLLGHTQPETTWRYAHVADEAQRQATNRFGEILSSGIGKDKAIGRHTAAIR
jgi:integrase